MTTEKQQTPLQKLISKISTEIENANYLSQLSADRDIDTFYLDRLIGLKLHAQSLLPEEKQMAIDNFVEGHARFTECEESELEIKAEQYFNETYQ